MKLTKRDLEVLETIEKMQGLTIEQASKFLFPSYHASAKRLKILNDNKFLKSEIHPVVGKKVYYTKKLPSYHSLVRNWVRIYCQDRILEFRAEYKIDRQIVDALLVSKKGNVYIIEIDLYNKTSKEKFTKCKEELSTKLGVDVKTVLITQRSRSAVADVVLRVGEVGEITKYII